jgi:hypothetical protein
MLWINDASGYQPVDAASYFNNIGGTGNDGVRLTRVTGISPDGRELFGECIAPDGYATVWHATIPAPRRRLPGPARRTGRPPPQALNLTTIPEPSPPQGVQPHTHHGKLSPLSLSWPAPSDPTTRAILVWAVNRAGFQRQQRLFAVSPVRPYLITASSWVFTPLASLAFPATLRASR